MNRKSIALLAFALALAPAAAQDECTSAITVVDGVNGVFTNVGMTTSAGSAAPTCLASYKNDIWFTYTALVTGSHKITTDTPGLVVQGTHTDTILDVFDGSVCPPTTSLACDDDSGITPALSSTLTVTLSAGLSYYIRVSSFTTAADGSFWLSINPAPPANDECSGAFSLALGINPVPATSGLSYTLTDSTLSAGWAAPTCDTTANNADVWFSFVPATSGLYQFDQETPGGFGAGTMTASVFDVFPDSVCSPTAAIACDDDGGTIVGSGGLVIASLTAGLTYYLRVTDDDAYSGGSFYVNVAFLGAPVANDECAGAIAITPGTNPAPAASGNFYTMDNSTLSAGWAAPTCDTTANSADVWFFFSCPTTGLWQFDQETPAGYTAGTLTATVFDVFPDTLCVPGAAIACDDDGGTVVASGGLVLANLTAGSNYFLRVTDDDGFNGGTFYVNATYVGLPAPNDECSGAIALALGANPAPAASGNFYSTLNSSLSAGWPVPTCDTVVLSDVWFSFTPAATGVYQFDQETPAGFTAGTLIGTVFDVFPNSGCSPTTAIGCDDDSGVIVALGGLVTVSLTAGQTYYLRVSVDDSGAQGPTFYVNVAFLGSPVTNDECASATAIIGTGTVFSNNFGATTSAGWPALSTCPTAAAAINLDVWFSYTPVTTDVYQFDTATPCGAPAGTMTNPTLALYDGSLGMCGTPFAHTACDGDSSIGSQAWLKATLIGGTTYYLRLGPATATGSAAVGATFYLTIRQGDIVNDTCATAIPLAFGTNPAPAASCSVYTNVGATESTGTVCATIAKDLWFSFTPASSGSFDIDTNTPCGYAPATGNTTLALYSGACPGSLLVCDADNGVGTLSSLTNVALNGGTTYLIRVGVSSTTGEGTFYVNVNPSTGGITNDECTGAITVGLGVNPAPATDCMTFTSAGSTTSAGWSSPCATTVNDVWFVFTPPHDGTYQVDLETPLGFTNGSMTNSTVSVFGSCTPAAPLACDADGGVTNGGANSLLQVQLTGGVPAYIRVGSSGVTVEGTFYLTITELFTLFFTSAPCAAGLVDVTANMLAGPANGGYFMCVTLNQGAYPNGWLYGIDPLFDEVLAQVQTPGFVGALSATGTATVGPVCGLPTGVFTLYGVALAFPTPAITIPIAATDPVVISP